MPKIDVSDLQDHIGERLFVVRGRCLDGCYVHKDDLGVIYIETQNKRVEIERNMSFYTTVPEAMEECGIHMGEQHG